ncbi:MAG: DUF6057 family protein, partial [Candidatus Symbiothrix sp.]|nr:DUF6057 family protein [Candidatus Symbiothrix sp.]
RMAAIIVLFLFATLAAGWLYFYNRYFILNFLEEGMLFRTDAAYLHTYLIQPGGLARYTGSFLTQFYHYPLLGAMIFAAVISAIYAVFMAIARRNGAVNRFFFLPYLIPVCLLLSVMDNMNYRLWHPVGILIALGFFEIYLLLRKNSVRYPAGIILYVAAYFITGGNAWLFTILLVTDEMFREKRSWIYLIAVLLLSAVVPWIAYQSIYVTPLDTAYFALTPFSEFTLKNTIFLLGWLSIPILYILWRVLAQFQPVVNLKKPGLWIAVYVLLIFLPALWGMKKIQDPESELIMRMSYEVERGNWDQVIEIGKTHVGRNAVPVSYFTNIALSEKGRLADVLFNYCQTGTYGLFITWKTHYTTTLYIGEWFYRMGMIQEAFHCAFESFVTSPVEHGSKALRRLVQTTMLLRDREGFERYIRLFEHAPVYKSWAKQQRKLFEQCLADSSFVPEGMPTPISIDDFHVEHGDPVVNLKHILDINPHDRKAFEYWADFYLLHLDLLSFYEVMENYYPAIGYQHPPRSIEEALVIYAVAAKDASTLNKYSVTKETVERFTAYNQIMESAQTPAGRNLLQKKFDNTYFYYYLNAKPMNIEEIYKMSIY